jgi:hypothetical protein
MRVPRKCNWTIPVVCALAGVLTGSVAKLAAQPLPTEERRFPNAPEKIPAQLAELAPAIIAPKLNRLHQEIQHEFNRARRRGPAPQGAAENLPPHAPPTDFAPGQAPPLLQITDFKILGFFAYPRKNHHSSMEPLVRLRTGERTCG